MAMVYWQRRRSPMAFLSKIALSIASMALLGYFVYAAYGDNDNDNDFQALKNEVRARGPGGGALPGYASNKNLHFF